MMNEPFVSGTITNPEVYGDKLYFTLDTDFVCWISTEHPCAVWVFEGSPVTCLFNWDSQVMFDVDNWADNQLQVAFISPNNFTYLDQPFLYGMFD